MKVYGIITIDPNNKIINNQISLDGLSNENITDCLGKRKDDENYLFITNILETTKYIWSLNKGVLVANGNSYNCLISPLLKDKLKSKKDYLNLLKCNSNSNYYTFDIMNNMNNFEFDTGKKPRKRKVRKGGGLVKYDTIKEQLLSIPSDIITDYILIHHEIQKIRYYRQTHTIFDTIKDIYGYFGENYKIFLIFKSSTTKYGEDIIPLSNSYNLNIYGSGFGNLRQILPLKCFKNLKTCKLREIEILNLPAKLKKLSLSHCNIKNNTFENLSGLIKLRLNECKINEIALKFLVNLRNLKLDGNYQNLTNKIFVYFPSLIKLSLISWYNLANESFKYFKNIKHLELMFGPVRINQIKKKAFSELKKVEILELNRMEFNNDVFGELFNLKKLIISTNTKLTGDFPSPLHKINEYYIRNCIITDIIIDKIPNAEIITFVSCQDIEFSSFRRGNNIKKLSFGYCDKITGKFPRVLPNIISAKFDSCDNLTDQIFQYIPNLKYMKIRLCDKITGNGFVNLKSLIGLKLHVTSNEIIPTFTYENIGLLKTLKYLHLNYIYGFKEANFFSFLLELENLERLYLPGYEFTENNYFLNLKKLKWLYINWVHRFKESIWEIFKKFITNLEVIYIKFSFMPEISWFENLKDITYDEDEISLSNKKSLFIGHIRKKFEFNLMFK